LDDLGSWFRLRQYRDVGRLRPIFILTALVIVLSSGMFKLDVVFMLELPMAAAMAATSSTAAAVSTMSMAMSLSLVVFAHVVLVHSISSSSGGR
jgi:hypothetical protein